ncbi:hypothetical protein DIS24_g148 [Lasiodiplodia hormozganensis]|uniref:N-acetyltransferase domain-containing protein n=1 Tax=Lasiodiplodia hormozganensis TaxID=869390 RepID=A0AA40D6E0_9PEZI|nr:hypothetical protein DIS24_g148 [Lasiodiplodia hormozganensis]
MVNPSGFSVRPPKSSEEIKSLWWPSMQSLGWNRSDKDHPTHWQSSRGKYIVLTHKEPSSSSSEEEEKAVGIILPITYPNKTGWVGFFVVEEAYRGTGGGGSLLFQAALDEFARQGASCVGLDGVLQQVGTYGRRGFVERGRVKLMVTKKVKELDVVPSSAGAEKGDGDEVSLIKALRDVQPAALVAADEKATGLRRTHLWTKELLVEREDAWGFAAVEEGQGGGGEEEEEEVTGFVLVRSCEHGYRVGPLYAPNRDLAGTLLLRAMQNIKGFGADAAEKSLVAEAWGENPVAVETFEGLGWEYSGMDYARMWLNGEETDAQKKGGVAEREVFAWFDAGEG